MKSITSAKKIYYTNTSINKADIVEQISKEKQNHYYFKEEVL